MNGRKGNRRHSRHSPVYEDDHPDRIAFIQQNAVALVREKDAVIRRQAEVIAKLEASIQNFRRERRALLDNHSRRISQLADTLRVLEERLT